MDSHHYGLVEHCGFLYYKPDWFVEQIIEMAAIWDPMAFIWRHCSWWVEVAPHVRSFNMCSLSSNHYSDEMMGAMASQITVVSIVCSTVCSDADQRNQGSVSVAFVTGGFPSQRASNTGIFFHLMMSACITPYVLATLLKWLTNGTLCPIVQSRHNGFNKAMQSRKLSPSSENSTDIALEFPMYIEMW